jgi:hypothetical protein
MLLNRGLSLMSSRWKSAAIIGSALLTSLLIPRASSANEPSAKQPAVWQKHEYSFVFMGFTSTYSCDGLADKIKLLLIAAGARHDAKSQPGACVDGVWRPVSIANRSPRDLGTGDCELVEQFRNNVLPMFTTRNVEDHTTCVPHQDSGSLISLRFESLTAPPRAPQDQPGGK